MPMPIGIKGLFDRGVGDNAGGTFGLFARGIFGGSAPVSTGVQRVATDGLVTITTTA